MTQNQKGIPMSANANGIQLEAEPASGPVGPQPKRSQPMSTNSLIEHDSPDDVETSVQRNGEIERP